LPALAEQRRIKENRVDHPASRLDPGSIKTRLQHDTAP